jgi:hypothetical protein
MALVTSSYRSAAMPVCARPHNARPSKVGICERGQILKTTRAANGEVVYTMIGRLDAENVGDLETLVSEETNRHHVVLDLKDLTLVAQDAVSFLVRCEAENIQLKNCPAYIREWITRERDPS